jgi:hypothetical protein
MIRCPVCGTPLDLAELNLTSRQQKIRDVIERLRRELGRFPYSWEIAVEINYTDRFVRYELVEMEQAGVVCRPHGPRSGWTLKKEHLTVIRAA